jgi:hypothetical protein
MLIKGDIRCRNAVEKGPPVRAFGEANGRRVSLVRSPARERVGEFANDIQAGHGEDRAATVGPQFLRHPWRPASCHEVPVSDFGANSPIAAPVGLEQQLVAVARLKWKEQPALTVCVSDHQSGRTHMLSGRFQPDEPRRCSPLLESFFCAEPRLYLRVGDVP